MTLVLRRPDDPSFEVILGDKPLSLGADADNDVRLADEGIAGRHAVITHVAIEALSDLDVGGVRLRAGRRRLCVPSVLRFCATTTLTIENAEDDSSVATRELVFRLGGEYPWRRVVVVEGPSSGGELTLRNDGAYVVGRGPDSDLAVEDPKMSRAHFEIELLEGAVFVRDRGSSSGVRLGGATLEPRRKAAWPVHRMLKAGDSVFAFFDPLTTVRRSTNPRGPSAALAVDSGPSRAIADAAASLEVEVGEGGQGQAIETDTVPHEEAVLSARGASPIASVDEEPTAAPVPVDANASEPVGLRIAFIVFVIVGVCCLAALAYFLIS